MKTFIKIILITLASLAISTTIGLYVTLYISQTLAYALIMTGGIVLMLYLITKFHWAYTMTALFSLATGVFMATFIFNATFWLQGDFLEDVTLKQATENQEATVFYFNEGKIFSQIYGLYKLASDATNPLNPNYDHYLVAPLVTDDWKPNDPVSVWAGCYYEGLSSQAFDYCKEHWDQPYQAGLKEPYPELFQEAILNTELISAQNSIIIEWNQDPRAEVNYTLQQTIKGPLLLSLITIIYTLIAFFSIKIFSKHKN